MTTDSSSVSAPVRAVRAALRGWRYLYGENPLHLLAMIGCFALSGYVVSLLWDEPSLPMLAVWFGGAVIGHDLVLYPLYAFADQPLTILRWGRRRVLPRRPPLVPAINHVRLPVLGAMVLGLIWFPSITGRGAEAFAFTAGHPMLGQYDNWLLITGALFTGSAIIYALRLGVAAGRGIVGLVRRRPSATETTTDTATDTATEAFAAVAVTPTAGTAEDAAAADSPTEAITTSHGGPTDETPAGESPADESPADGSPADGSPADESPTDESPTEEPPRPVSPGERAG